MTDIDWESLRARAFEAMHHAYAPYSNFMVGAAGLVDDGRTVTGCNVENASYGLSLCAECGLVSRLVESGGGKLVAVSCVDKEGHPLAPCGRCRQLLLEMGSPELVIDSSTGPVRIKDLLPGAFSAADLENR